MGSGSHAMKSPDTITNHALSYPRFLTYSISRATNGSALFYGWMALLTGVLLVGLHAWASQNARGMVATNMTDQVSWGLYIANFTFMVGVAAGAVMMIIPGYLYRNKDMHHLSIFGELLAVAALIMCLAFVTVDIGRPDRAWHLLPIIGRSNFPHSMLAWDVVVLTGYLLINLHVSGYILYQRFLGNKPNPKWYLPFVYLSIFWAFSIHSVTAFLYSGLGSRPFWNSALLAPRFLATAFVSGPACIVVALFIVKRFFDYQVPGDSIRLLVKIIRVTIMISLFMVIAEVFTEFYTGSTHSASARYLFFGLHGQSALVPWIWTSLAFMVIAAALFLHPRAMRSAPWVITACVLAFVGTWIEKGMGLIVPGFIPSTIGEVVEYQPSALEWRVMAGIWALGLMLYTIAIRIAVPVLKHEQLAAATVGNEGHEESGQ